MNDHLRNHVATSNDRAGSAHEAVVATRYVKLDETTDGWIKVALEDGGFTFICEFTKLTMVRSAGGRRYFRIADGWSRSVGKVGSLTEENAEKYLTARAPAVSTEKVRVKYGAREVEVSPFKGRLLQQWGALSIQDQIITVTLNSLWDQQFTPIAPGLHRIMSPDASHAKTSTRGYRDAFPGKIKGNDVWFPIELAGTKGNSSRFVHLGHLSEGCVTVHDIARWNVVYDFLISHRLPGTDGKYVCLLEVTA